MMNSSATPRQFHLSLRMISVVVLSGAVGCDAASNRRGAEADRQAELAVDATSGEGAPTGDGEQLAIEPAGRSVAEIDEANFDAAVLQSPLPVLVDFWAPWCGPCRMVAPVIEELAAENQGSIKVAKMNVDDSPRLAQQLGLDSIPTIMLIKNGEIVERFVGVQPKHVLQAAINSHAQQPTPSEPEPR